MRLTLNGEDRAFEAIAHVADLVAAGQTNREVAAATFTSVRTVESHLGRIYRKLGVSSRHQAVTRAREAGLLEG